MLNEYQRKLAREHGGNAQPEPDCFTWVEGALSEVKRLISWLEYVAENEYSNTAERAELRERFHAPKKAKL